MFAGLPGIGVGTLFYVLSAFWMPFRELPLLLRGQSSVKRWRLIARQLVFALSIIVCVAAADVVLGWMLGTRARGSFSPTRILNDQMSAQAPQSILAAPVAAALLMLGAVLLCVELARLVAAMRGRATAPAPLATVSTRPSQALQSEL